jgi:hypothetical protein
MIVMVGLGVEGSLDRAQAIGAGELGEQQSHEMLPAVKGLAIGIAVMALDNLLEPPPIDRLEKACKDASPLFSHRHSWFGHLAGQTWSRSGF